MLETKKFDISPAVAIIIAGFVIAAAIIFVGKFPAPAGGVAQVAGGANVPAPSAEDHIKGSRSAPIVLIEYSDFQCPYCQRINPTLQQLVDESNGEIAWVYRHYPLESIHSEARPAALASECVAEQLGNDGFWEFANRVFADQGSMNAAQYLAIATELGANPAQYGGCVASNKYGAKIDAQSTEAQVSGGNGTPYTIIYAKGKQVPINGALPYAQIKSVIDHL
jgi:protein-disulfide isomerase